jgi:hypothetical protein
MDDYNKARIEAMERQLKWYELFAEYIEDKDYHLYNYACDYANDNEDIC